MQSQRVTDGMPPGRPDDAVVASRAASEPVLGIGPRPTGPLSARVRERT
ncbi:hypothetical protein [Streptomyces wedmorensis]